MKIIETDNGSGYPDEKFINLPRMNEEAAGAISDVLNNKLPGKRLWKMVKDDYILNTIGPPNKTILRRNNDELGKSDNIGEIIKCPNCQQIHNIEYGEQVLKDGTKIPSKLLGFYTCGGAKYIAGINGKKI